MQRKRTSGWHGNRDSEWIRGAGSAICRNYAQSIFSFHDNFVNTPIYSEYTTDSHSRSTIIVGSGLLYERSRNLRVEGNI